MAKKIAPRFLRDSGVEPFNGNELLLKGALETEGGVHLLTGYPGSPVSTFFDVAADCGELLRERGIEARISGNEALAAAAANGSQMGPLRTLVVAKSVGIHVASDALAMGNVSGAHPRGGVVVVCGDDPGSETTQVPADSRFLCRHMFMPTLEPSTPQEVKDYIGAGFQLSQASGLYIGYIITTTLADGGGSVTCRPNHYPLTNMNHPFELESAAIDIERTVVLPPRTGRHERELPERFDRLARAAERLGLNRLIDVAGQDELLIVTSGMAFQYTRQALADLDVAGRVPVLKLAVTYPLDRRLMEPLLRRFAHVLVVEERRPFIEEQLAQLAIRASQSIESESATQGEESGVSSGERPRTGDLARIWGKQFPRGTEGLPEALGLSASTVSEKLGAFLEAIGSPLRTQAAPGVEQQRLVAARTAEAAVPLPVRTPTFCPGCPHRDSSSVLLEIKKRFTDPAYMRRRHGRGPVDLVFHGDAGCYTMLLFEPNTPLMHNYSGMGLGAGTGSGIDPFISNKQVVFMGDGTFFHSGIAAISNSVASRQDITYVILANDTIAMTGHQPHAALTTDLLDRVIPAQDIERIVHGIIADESRVVRVDPGERDGYERLLEQTILADGVKVVIAEKECGITHNRRVMAAERAEQGQLGFVRRKVHMNVTTEVCEFCLECTRQTGCPGLTIEPTPYGPKMATDLSWCVNDSACAKIAACPSFEEVIVTRKRRPTPRGHKIMLEDIPEPKITFEGDTWRAWLAGVGGMGIGTATSILVFAGRHEGYHVQFSDKKGLAIRNGSVYSQLVFSKNRQPDSMSVAQGQADLLLGIDLLEGARAVSANAPFRVASPYRTAVVVNNDVTPTIRTLMGLEEFKVDQLEEALRRVARKDGYFSARVTSLCERLFGTKLYANITLVGVAYQLGLIPVSLEGLKEGIRQTIRADIKKNLRAFDVGRKLVSRPELFGELFGDQMPSRSLARTVREKAAYLNMQSLGVRRALRKEQPGAVGRRRLPDTKVARAYKHMVYTTLRACRELDRATMRDIAIRIYDLTQWGGIRYAQRYVRRVRRVFLTDDERYGFAATRAVVLNLARLMLIKDEFYVSHLLTSFEKRRRDRQRYNVNPANGDRIRYRRTFHPRLLFGKRVDVPFPHWGLYVMRNLRFLRRVIPWYRHKERRFLRWYEQLVDDFAFADAASYSSYVEALETVASVTGFAEIRWPKMEAARHRAGQILTDLRRAERSRAQKLAI